jgi:hypothetical protein
MELGHATSMSTTKIMLEKLFKGASCSMVTAAGQSQISNGMIELQWVYLTRGDMLE